MPLFLDGGFPNPTMKWVIGTNSPDLLKGTVEEGNPLPGICADDKDNDVGAEMAIALTGVTSMTAADFVL